MHSFSTLIAFSCSCRKLIQPLIPVHLNSFSLLPFSVSLKGSRWSHFSILFIDFGVELALRLHRLLVSNVTAIIQRLMLSYLMQAGSTNTASTSCIYLHLATN